MQGFGRFRNSGALTGTLCIVRDIVEFIFLVSFPSIIEASHALPPPPPPILNFRTAGYHKIEGMFSIGGMNIEGT